MIWRRKLRIAGCTPGDLKLIVLTHGDYDHAGNAAYLRAKYGVGIAMHRADAGRVERADWSLGMKPKPDKFPLLFRTVSAFVRPGPFDAFTPDVFVEDGQDLRAYGLDATILHLPGHTRGSIGVLTAAGDLFCGDLMDSMMGRPSLEFFIDDMAAAEASLARLRSLDVAHGLPGPRQAVPARTGQTHLDCRRPLDAWRGALLMVAIEGEITIARPPEEVFDFVADQRNEPRFNPQMLSAEQVSPGPIGLGTRFRAKVTSRGRPLEMIIEFTAYERPRRLSSWTHLSAMDIRGTLTFDPVPGGTRMGWHWELAPRGFLRLLTPLVARMGRRQEEAIWAGLKRVLEGQEAPPAIAEAPA